jgi:hypothetical protein
MAETERRHERVDILCTWLQYDVLQLPANCQLPTANCQLPTANCPADREKRFDFMVEELSAVSDEARIQSTIRSLISQTDDLLAVAHSLDLKFQNMAEKYAVSIQDV